MRRYERGRQGVGGRPRLSSNTGLLHASMTTKGSITVSIREACITITAFLHPSLRWPIDLSTPQVHHGQRPGRVISRPAGHPVEAKPGWGLGPGKAAHPTRPGERGWMTGGAGAGAEGTLADLLLLTVPYVVG